MTSVILPTGVSVGLLGLLLSAYTPVFDWLGMIFYPLLAVLQVPEAMLTAVDRRQRLPRCSFLPACWAMRRCYPATSSV